MVHGLPEDRPVVPLILRELRQGGHLANIREVGVGLPAFQDLDLKRRGGIPDQDLPDLQLGLKPFQRLSSQFCSRGGIGYRVVLRLTATGRCSRPDGAEPVRSLTILGEFRRRSIRRLPTSEEARRRPSPGSCRNAPRWVPLAAEHPSLASARYFLQGCRKDTNEAQVGRLSHRRGGYYGLWKYHTWDSSERKIKSCTRESLACRLATP